MVARDGWQFEPRFAATLILFLDLIELAQGYSLRKKDPVAIFV